MTVAQFLNWASSQPRGRYELVRGEVVTMAPERVRHALVKGAVFRALGDAVKGAGLPCTAFPDGMTVVIDNEHAREPDAAVQCGPVPDLDSMVLHAPLIVVEVTSPSTEKVDTGDKVGEYFSVASIQHYLIVDPVERIVIHHQRSGDGTDATHRVSAGEINLAPLGMKVPVAELLPEIG
jgi:Uma2 family endonuclease